MKVRGLNYFFSGIKSVVKRFAVSIFFATLSFGLSCLLIQNPQHIQLPLLRGLLLASILGISFSLALTLFFERVENRNNYISWLPVLASGLSFAFFLTRFLFTSGNRIYFDFAIGAMLSHLAVSLVWHWNNFDNLSFWQYNRLLFIRILSSFLLSGILYTGIAIILLTSHVLFDIYWEKAYLYVWVFIAFEFGTLFFLQGLPNYKDFNGSAVVFSPNLKFLTQYILIPLTLIYLALLYLYGAKICSTQNWPKGILSYMVSGLSIVGIVGLLLVYPISQIKEYKWIRFYSKIFYLMILPLLFLMMTSLIIRSRNYGITENRYLLFVCCVWLMGLAIFYLVTQSKNIKWIPLSLFSVSVIISLGPWGATDSAKRSQLDRLRALLLKVNCLDQTTNKFRPNCGKIFLSKTQGSISKEPMSKGSMSDVAIGSSETKMGPNFNDEKQLSSIMDYLVDRHGIESLEFLFTSELKQIISKEFDHDYSAFEGMIFSDSYRNLGSAQASQKIMNYLKLRYWYSWENMDRHYFNFFSNDESILKLGNGLYQTEIIYPFSKNVSNIREDGPYQLEVLDIEKDQTNLVVQMKKNKRILFEMNISPLLNRLSEKYSHNPGISVPSLDMFTHVQSDQVEAHLQLRAINGELKNPGPGQPKATLQINSLTALLFWIEKQ